MLKLKFLNKLFKFKKNETIKEEDDNDKPFLLNCFNLIATQ
jgi:hypothetical protein